MRILSLSTSDWRGGAAKVAYYLTAGLRERGHHADLLVQEKASDASFVEELPRLPKRHRDPISRRIAYRLSYDALNLSSPNGNSAFSRERLAKYDLVHIHDQPPVSLVDLFRKVKKPLVWTVHSMTPLTGNCNFSFDCDRWTKSCGSCPKFGIWPLIYQHRDASAEVLKIKRFIYSRMNFQAVGVSDWTTRQISQSVMGCQPHQTVQNPSWTPDYHPVDRNAARTRLGVPENAFAIMFSVSGNSADLRKGFDLVVEAARKIRAEWPDADRVFLLPTGIISPDDKLAMALSDLNGLPPRHVSDVSLLRDYYNAADIVWHPSRADTSSMVSLEAFGCGTPVIAAQVGGVPEIVEQERCGLLIPSNDSGALVAATRRLIDNPDLSNSLRAGALSKAHEHSPERFVDDYVSVYNRAIAQLGKISPNLSAAHKLNRNL